MAEVDEAVRAAGYPMGPFALMDLVGIDVNLAAARGIYNGALVAGDPLAERFRPSPIQERLVAAGNLGRKTGEGFFRYDQDAKTLGGVDEIAAVGGHGGLAPEVIVERITLAIVNEAYRALDEGSLPRPTSTRPSGSGRATRPARSSESRNWVAERRSASGSRRCRRSVSDFAPAAALSASGYPPR